MSFFSFDLLFSIQPSPFRPLGGGGPLSRPGFDPGLPQGWAQLEWSFGPNARRLRGAWRYGDALGLGLGWKRHEPISEITSHDSFDHPG